MYLRPSNRVTQIEAAAAQLVHCRGLLPDGTPCDGLIEVPLYEKSVCAHCGWVVSCYRDYSTPVTIEKAESLPDACDPSFGASAGQLAPSPFSQP